MRTHLSALVNHNIVSPDVPCSATAGLTVDIWHKYLQDSSVGGHGSSAGLGEPGAVSLQRVWHTGRGVKHGKFLREGNQPGCTEPETPNPWLVGAGE